jgi:truncated hemoglobin YjbI
VLAQFAMQESHQDLRITAAEWDAFLDDLQDTLDKFGVPQAEQEELKAIVASARNDWRQPRGVCAEPIPLASAA